VPIRAFRPADARALAALSHSAARGETDFVLNPLWEHEDDLFAEYDRHGVEPEQHLLVAESANGVEGCVGFVRRPEATTAGLVCPIVAREARGRGVGGELLRAALAHGAGALGVKLVAAAIGVRNRAGYALLTALGFRPRRQHFLMRLDAAPAAPRPPLAGLELSAAVADDARELLAIHAECGFEPRDEAELRAALADRRRAFAVARYGGRVVAFAEVERHWPARPWLAYVGVEPQLRDRGVGSALAAFALAREFERGARAALLLLSPGNRTALRAYEKAGFRRHRLVDVLERGL
jgi:ribosomal protein S18 acetylase RimI-like enzyme